MTTIYQLSRQACPPCQVLKNKINLLENKFFNYVYVDIDKPLFKGSIEEEILSNAMKKGHRSLPIVGVTNTSEDDTETTETIELVVSLNPDKLEQVLELIK